MPVIKFPVTYSRLIGNNDGWVNQFDVNKTLGKKLENALAMNKYKTQVVGGCTEFTVTLIARKDTDIVITHQMTEVTPHQLVKIPVFFNEYIQESGIVDKLTLGVDVEMEITKENLVFKIILYSMI